MVTSRNTHGRRLVCHFTSTKYTTYLSFGIPQIRNEILQSSGLGGHGCYYCAMVLPCRFASKRESGNGIARPSLWLAVVGGPSVDRAIHEQAVPVGKKSMMSFGHVTARSAYFTCEKQPCFFHPFQFANHQRNPNHKQTKETEGVLGSIACNSSAPHHTS